ncbi:MAG: hypothetical protein AB7V36_03995 [Bacteroidales bacterium]
MKTITSSLLILFVLISYNYAQTPIPVFNNCNMTTTSPPWIYINCEQWLWTSGDPVIGLANDDAAGMQGMIVSPALDISVCDNGSTPYMKFDLYKPISSAGGNAVYYVQLDISDDAGATWTVLDVFEPLGTGSFSTMWYNLSAYSGQNDVMFRIHAIGAVDATSGQTQFPFIDNIEVKCVPPPSDCNNHVDTMHCGETLTGLTTIGAGNSVSSWNCHTDAYGSAIPTLGEDLFFAFEWTLATAGTARLTFTNVTGTATYAELIFMGTPCVEGDCDQSGQRNMPQTTSDTTTFQYEFTCPGPGMYYFAVDQQSPSTYINFDVNVMCFETGIIIDTINSCYTDPILTPIDQGFYTTWNGALAPWNYDATTGGTMEVCEHVYLRNAGWEYLKYYSMDVGECWINIRNIWPNGAWQWYATPYPAWCNTRGWSGTITGNSIDWTFLYPYNHYAKVTGTWYCGWLSGSTFYPNTAPNWGDGINLGGPYSCAYYKFCYIADIDPTCYEAYGLQNTLTLTDDAIGGTGGTSASTIIYTYDWAYNQNNPLPIKLFSFDATCKGSSVLVSWTTASETNNDFFTIERSVNGFNFEPVGKIEGAGNSNDLNKYLFEDEAFPYPVYYRLQQTDFDGNSSTTKSITVYCSDQSLFDLTVSDNSSDGFISVSFNSLIGTQYIVTLIDGNGKLVYNEIIMAENDNMQLQINTNHLSQGLYVLNVKSNIINHSQKVFLK